MNTKILMAMGKRGHFIEGGLPILTYHQLSDLCDKEELSQHNGQSNRTFFCDLEDTTFSFPLKKTPYTSSHAPPSPHIHGPRKTHDEVSKETAIY